MTYSVTSGIFMSVLQKVGCCEVYITQFCFGKINDNYNTHVSVVCMTLQEFREKDTGKCILGRKATRKISKGKISEISFVILFSYKIMRMYVNIYVTELCQKELYFSMIIRLT